MSELTINRHAFDEYTRERAQSPMGTFERQRRERVLREKLDAFRAFYPSRVPALVAACGRWLERKWQRAQVPEAFSEAEVLRLEALLSTKGAAFYLADDIVAEWRKGKAQTPQPATVAPVAPPVTRSRKYFNAYAGTHLTIELLKVVEPLDVLFVLCQHDDTRVAFMTFTERFFAPPRKRGGTKNAFAFHLKDRLGIAPNVYGHFHPSYAPMPKAYLELLLPFLKQTPEDFLAAVKREPFWPL